MYEPIDQSFFEKDTLELAQQLLGHYIVHEQQTGLLVGRIVETEAYQGPEDRAAHSFRNRRTKRTEIMFQKPGYAYTYQMHTHTLLNVVAGSIETPHAVLIRAIEPVLGMEQMRLNRGAHVKEVNLTNGPGKLTKALGITMQYYGHHLLDRPLFISQGEGRKEIAVSPRVGIGNTGDAVHYPWRFYEKDNPFVSKYRL
ncbi:DNA-3-methyladenine glycosylase [Pseudogracilibacillus auburnensis]|uniref:Putative 3-methyladenine DNA glycosylase n=1 Tax=Pseudogracilibacillus auburnensis TaxID=1494959 RepID=A0A2V3W7I6_9BACI|nr:DNA-3-methyladenine glycosylase [Pseudogracilibacillus auburnensis]PXW90287.1 DNA-3-methyladenine glycosylase [Pseudogracilibacillus auburnensis]